MPKYKNHQADDYLLMLEAITLAQSQFVSNKNSRELFDRLLDNLLKLTHSEYGFIGEIIHDNSQTPYLKTHAITDISWNEDTKRFYEEGAPEGLEFTNLDTLFGAVITTGKPVISNSPSTDSRAGGIPGGHPSLDAFLGIPFYSGDTFIGMVGLANRPQGYDNELVDFLEPFLATCSQLIEAHHHRNARSEAEEKLKTAKLAAEIANTAKSQFLANMSHELRTPLNAIIGYSEMLIEEEELNSYEDDIKKILFSGKHLLNLVDDILDLSKVESGNFEINAEKFDFKVLIEELESIISPMAQKNNNSFLTTVDSNLTELFTDRRKLFQVFLNLLNNAFKFTENGEVRFSIDCVVLNDIESLQACVQDTGIGIPNEKIKDIFNPFIQVDSSTTRGYSGSGLGLAICKRFCDLLGGTIECESELGKGTKFTVILPIKLSS